MPTFNPYTKCVGGPGMIYDHPPDCNPSCLGMDAWMTSQLKVAFIRKLRGSLMWLDYFFDTLSLGVCITRHWQTSGRLVQELNACRYCEIFKGMCHFVQITSALLVWVIIKQTNKFNNLEINNGLHTIMKNRWLFSWCNWFQQNIVLLLHAYWI